MKSLTLVLFVFVTLHAKSQEMLTLDECYARSESRYPLIRQRDLLEKTGEYSIENATKGYLPRVSLGGQATYQSAVTQIPVEMPGVEPLSKDQYRVFGEIAQTIFHGGLVSAQKQTEEVNRDVEESKLAVGLYALKSRINELFLGILLLQEQTIQSELIKKDLNAALRKTEAAIANGTAIHSAADVLKAEALRIEQRTIEMTAAGASYREVLGIFIDQRIPENTVLEKPVFPGLRADINRPELHLFDMQKIRIEAQRAVLAGGNKPRLELFVQGGYGRPGLNMLENAFDSYFLGGVRFSWLISGYYTFRKENEILSLRQQSLDVQKETFVFNTGLSLRQHESEIAKFRRLMEVDDEIIALRIQVRRTAEAQQEEGVISPADFIREVNAEDQAKQNRALHEIQLLMAQARYHLTSGQ